MPHLAITAQRYGPISLEKEPRLAAGLERCCSYIARIKRIGVNVASESIGPEQKNPLGVPPLNRRDLQAAQSLASGEMGGARAAMTSSV